MASSLAPYNTPLTRIPLQPAQAQSLGINLNGTDYRFRLNFNASDPFSTGGTWILDIGDESGVPIVCGIPLLPGQNLLAQYGYLEIGGGGALFCYGAGAAEGEIPGWDTLGVSWQLYFAPYTYRLTTLSGLATIPQTLAQALLAANNASGSAA